MELDSCVHGLKKNTKYVKQKKGMNDSFEEGEG